MSLSSRDCTEAERRRYYSRISGPLLDRVDIQIEVPPVKFRDIAAKSEGESSLEVRQRVISARERQLCRFKGKRIYANGQMGPKEIKRYCPVDQEGERLLEMAVTRLGVSARAYDRILKMARTIADLAGEDEINPAYVSEAIQYRMMDRYY